MNIFGDNHNSKDDITADGHCWRLLKKSSGIKQSAYLYENPVRMYD